MTAGLDWDAQWWSSLWWTVKVCAGSVAGLVVIGWALARLTRWGRQFAALNLSYFIPGRTWVSWRAALSVLAMVWLAVADVRLTVLVSYATNGMFTAMQNFSGSDFARFLAIFALLAALNVIVEIALYYTERMFVLHWRMWLNGRMVNDWLTGAAYHKGRFVADPVDNPDQRIQEDITNFCEDSQTLGLGAVRAVVSLASFTVVLWSLSGPMTIAGTQVPRAMTFFAYLYVIAASVLAFRVGRPLIRLNFRNEGLSAAFRYALVRVRENSEAIAFYRGEHAEAATLGARFSAIITNYWALVRRGVKLEAVNLSVSQLAVIFPYLLQAPRFFAHAVTLGGVHQTATAFGEVHDSLSFFRDSYDDFAKYRATLDRLTGLAEANARSRELPSITISQRPDGVRARELTVTRPDGSPLIEHLDLTLAGGQSLLITGASGSGKTSLLRALAGLWPYASGEVSRPTGERVLFLAYRPYLPLGTLRAALAYPHPPEALDVDTAHATLRQVALGHLQERLDEDRDWTAALSPGEQQRLAFARALITAPRLLICDEATAAVEEGLEHALFTLLREQLPATTVISTGHRASLELLHQHHLALLGQGRWGARQLAGAPDAATADNA